MATFKSFAKGLEKVVNDINSMQNNLINIQSNYFLAEVIKATPVNKVQSAPTRGQLRRNWDREKIKNQGPIRSVKVYNNTLYASWVELGHRKSNKTGWVEGQFFMENTRLKVEDDIEKISSPVITSFFNKNLFRG